jgi:hypothetical protein
LALTVLSMQLELARARVLEGFRVDGFDGPEDDIKTFVKLYDPNPSLAAELNKAGECSCRQTMM